MKFSVEIVASGREVVEEINSRLRDQPYARNAAVAVFRECYLDHGSNDEWSVVVTQDDAAMSVSVTPAEPTQEGTPS